MRICILLALVSQARPALAQIGPNEYSWPREYYEPVPPLPPHLGESYHHDSTAAGNILRGWSSVVHASGSYWLSVSQAAILWEVAAALDERNHWQRVAFRAGNQQRLEAIRQRSKEAKRASNQAQHRNKLDAAYRLTPAELNRATGEIVWPKLLRATEYAGLRSQLDELFRQRADYGGGPVDAPVDAEIVDLVKALIRDLQRNLRRMSDDERAAYMTAQKFLRGMKYEGEFTARGAGSGDPRTALTQGN